MNIESQCYQKIITKQKEIKSNLNNFNFKNLIFKQIEDIYYLDLKSLENIKTNIKLPQIPIQINNNIFLIWNFILSNISNLGIAKFKQTKFYNNNIIFNNIFLSIDGLILPKILSFLPIKITNLQFNSYNIEQLFSLNWAKVPFKKNNIELKLDIKPSTFYNISFEIIFNMNKYNIKLFDLYQYIIFYNNIIKNIHLNNLQITKIQIFNNLFTLSYKHQSSLNNCDLNWKLKILQNNIIKDTQKMNYITDIKQLLKENSNLTPKQLAIKLAEINHIDTIKYNIFEVYKLIKNILSVIHDFISKQLTFQLLSNKKFQITNFNNINYILDDNTKINIQQSLNFSASYTNLDSISMLNYYNTGFGKSAEINYNIIIPLTRLQENAKTIGLISLNIENNQITIIIHNKYLFDFIKNESENRKKIETELLFNDAFKIFEIITQAKKYLKQQQQDNNKQLLTNIPPEIKNIINSIQQDIANINKLQTNNQDQNFINNYHSLKHTSNCMLKLALENNSAIDETELSILLEHYFLNMYMYKNISDQILPFINYKNKQLIFNTNNNISYPIINSLIICYQIIINLKYQLKNNLQIKTQFSCNEISLLLNNVPILTIDNINIENQFSNLYLKQEYIQKFTNSIIEKYIKPKKYTTYNSILEINIDKNDLINNIFEIIDLSNNNKFQINLLSLDFLVLFLNIFFKYKK